MMKALEVILFAVALPFLLVGFGLWLLGNSMVRWGERMERRYQDKK